MGISLFLFNVLEKICKMNDFGASEFGFQTGKTVSILSSTGRWVDRTSGLFFSPRLACPSWLHTRKNTSNVPFMAPFMRYKLKLCVLSERNRIGLSFKVKGGVWAWGGRTATPQTTPLSSAHTGS
jgi:hypothetical protein